MDPRTQERVERWDSRPFDGGTDGLSDLADRGFSGAIHANEAWLFVLNGRAVGTVGGDVEDVLAAPGTRYDAPDPALPLLAAMETSGGETRAKYYTNETPIEEVDETLQDGSFTGYIELSEKVLSGDYYLVYYGGRRMAAAFIGNAERLITDEEAFERAADEVGIYEVIDVDIDVTDLRELVDAASDSDATDAPTGAAEPSDADDPSTDEPAAVEEPTADSSTPGETAADDPAASDPEPDDRVGITAAGDRPTDPSSPGIAATPDVDDTDETPSTADVQAATSDDATESGVAADETIDDGPAADEPASTEPEPSATAGEDATTDAPADRGRDSSERPAEPSDAAGRPDEPDAGTADDADGSSPSPADGASADAASDDRPDAGDATDDDFDLEEQFKEEERWRETRRIPSIDPENEDDSGDGSRRRSRRSAATARRRSTATESARSGSGSGSAGRTASRSTGAQSTGDREQGQGQPARRSSGASQRRSTADSSTPEPGSGRAEAGTLEKLTGRIETLEERCEKLSAQRDELVEERDRLRSTTEEQSTTIDRLQSRIDELESELERARAAGSAGAAGGTQLSAQQALAGTNLFVRYDSKSRATLETAHAGDADASEVDSNLRLEHHTEFEDADAVVDGDPFAEFLPSTMEFRTVDWLVNTLVYEIRDTGHADDLGDLYDAIPRIDRAEFQASISLEDDDTEHVPDEVGFDVVIYDKRGNPLIVLVLNDSREPASRQLLEDLEASASAVKANYPDLAAALVVTSSFFEPGALEVTEKATSSGFLSRGSKLSYVNLTRKRGYHLCLVEARSGGFHVTVPEL